MLIVSRLDASALSEACESLIETYRWTFKPQVALPMEPARQTLAIKPKMKVVESRPFDFDEE